MRIEPGVATPRPAGHHELVSALFAAFVSGRRQPFGAVVHHGITAGELPPETDVEATIDELAGPLCYQRFVTSRPSVPPEVDDQGDGCSPIHPAAPGTCRIGVRGLAARVDRGRHPTWHGACSARRRRG